MRVALLTREYPPDVYGGAGVHVEYLARELARLEDVDRPRLGRRRPADGRRSSPTAVGRAGRRRAAAGRAAGDVDRPGDGRRRRGRRLRPQPHLVREPRRPPGQAPATTSRTSRPCTASSRCGRGRPSSSAAATRCRAGASAPRSRRADAVIAVSRGDAPRRARVLSGARPGAGAASSTTASTPRSTSPIPAPTCSSATGSTRRARRSCSSGGSRARRAFRTCCDAALRFDPRAARALRGRARHARDRRRGRALCVERARGERGDVIWIEEMLPKPDVIQLLSHATVFVCPSIYEPLGIVNLEAMACEARGRRLRVRRNPRDRGRVGSGRGSPHAAGISSSRETPSSNAVRVQRSTTGADSTTTGAVSRMNRSNAARTPQPPPRGRRMGRRSATEAGDSRPEGTV